MFRDCLHHPRGKKKQTPKSKRMADVSFKILKGNSIHSDGSSEEALMRRLLKLVWEGEREQTRDGEVRSGKVSPPLGPRGQGEEIMLTEPRES